MQTSQAHNLEPNDRILIEDELATVESCECGELIATTDSGELRLFNSTTGFDEIETVQEIVLLPEIKGWDYV